MNKKLSIILTSAAILVSLSACQLNLPSVNTELPEGNSDVTSSDTSSTTEAEEYTDDNGINNKKIIKKIHQYSYGKDGSIEHEIITEYDEHGYEKVRYLPNGEICVTWDISYDNNGNVISVHKVNIDSDKYIDSYGFYFYENNNVIREVSIDGYSNKTYIYDYEYISSTETVRTTYVTKEDLSRDRDYFQTYDPSNISSKSLRTYTYDEKGQLIREFKDDQLDEESYEKTIEYNDDDTIKCEIEKRDNEYDRRYDYTYSDNGSKSHCELYKYGNGQWSLYHVFDETYNENGDMISEEEFNPRGEKDGDYKYEYEYY